MRIMVLCPVAQHLGHVISRIEGGQIVAQLRESLLHLRLGQEVETTGTFAEHDDTADGQKIKSNIEVGFEPASPLGESAHFAELLGPERDDSARFAEVGAAD